MPLTFKRLSLSVLALCGCIAAADASTVIKKSDTFLSGIRNDNWDVTYGSDKIFTSQNDHLYLRRATNSAYIQQANWRSTFSGKQNAWIYDVSITVHLPHQIVAPAGDSNDGCRVGLGFLINYPEPRYLELTVVDSLAGRAFNVATYNGNAIKITSTQLPAEIDKTVIIRLTLANGLVKTMWKKPGGVFKKVGPNVDVSQLVATAPSVTQLRPYLMGNIQGGAACPLGWNIWMDDFTLIYQYTP